MLFVSATAAGVLGLLWLGLDIGGTVTCPSPEEVARKVRPLLRGGTVGDAGDRVSIDRRENVIRVALLRADGHERGARNLDARHDCDELADAAAVIVASWQPVAEPALGVPPLEASATTTRPSAAEAAVAVRRVHVGLAAAGDWAPRSLAAGLALEATWGRVRGGPGLHLRAAYLQHHSFALNAGDVAWRRIPAALGPAWSWRFGGFDLETDLALAAAWLTVAGSGFAANENASALDFGIATGFRVAARGAFAPWGGLALIAWPRRTLVTVDAGARGALPRVQGLVELGLAWGRGQ
jgi:hypothetical protein